MNMTSRERVSAALNHQTPDKVPVDLGSAVNTGINASVLSKLRNYYGLEKRDILINDAFQMLGYVEQDLVHRIGGDVVGISLPYNKFGVKNDNWKDFVMFDGTLVKMPGGMKFTTDDNGNLYTYPKGDDTVPPSGMMPNNGCYFDIM